MKKSDKKLPEFSFVQENGAEISFQPTWQSTRPEYSGAGPEFVFEARKELDEKKGSLVGSFKIKVEARGQGDDTRLVIILTAEEGQPLQIYGQEWNHDFKAKHASFSPDRRAITINGLTEKGFRVEVPESALRHLELHGTLVKPPSGDLY